MLANGVKETTATTGIGTVTLSAVTGFVRFSQAFVVGDPVSYAIRDGDNWEWGVGTVGASNTLSRDVAIAKFDSGTYSQYPATKLSLAGSAEVACADGIASGTGDLGALSWGKFGVSDMQPLANIIGSNLSTAVNSAGLVTVYPFTVSRPVRLSAIGVNVTTAAAGSTIDVAIYNSALNTGQITAGIKLATVTGLSGATTGVKSGSVDILLRPGTLYFAGILALGGAPTLAATTGAQTTHHGLGRVKGISNTYPPNIARYYSGQIALPDPFGLGTVGTGSVVAVLLGAEA